jgi:hypothetical protein
MYSFYFFWIFEREKPDFELCTVTSDHFDPEDGIDKVFRNVCQ